MKGCYTITQNTTNIFVNVEEQKNFNDALEVFQAALDVAEQDKDKQARLAIVNAIDHIKDKQQRQGKYCSNNLLNFRQITNGLWFLN